MEEYKDHSAADLVMGCFLILFGTAVGLASTKMPIYKNFLDAPGFFPFLLGVIFISLGSMMTFSALKRKGFSQLKLSLSKSSRAVFLKDPRVKKASILIVLMMIYIFGLVGRIHFTLATFLYLMGTFLFLKSTKLWKMVLISLVTAIAISSLFSYVLRIPLP